VRLLHRRIFDGWRFLHGTLLVRWALSRRYFDLRGLFHRWLYGKKAALVRAVAAYVDRAMVRLHRVHQHIVSKNLDGRHHALVSSRYWARGARPSLGSYMPTEDKPARQAVRAMPTVRL
jgi:hypothetical protein